MSDEMLHDTAGEAPVLASGTVEGCHAGAERMRADAAGANPDLMEDFARDYPQGPHDKPQSMCPAFGSLRVGHFLGHVRHQWNARVACTREVEEVTSDGHDVSDWNTK